MAPIVGRRAEMTSLRRLLRRSDVRLVTLTGPGGVGKTRLALELCKALGGEYPGGVAFVALAAVREPALFAAAVARGFGLCWVDEKEPLAAAVDALTGRRCLLVLDNLEQLVPAVPDLADLLAACPDLTVLVTSRVRLGVLGGHEIPIAPLPVASPAQEVPSAKTAIRLGTVDAVRLFAERARAAAPAFELTDATAPVVSAICRRLDGLPLAIELAATRMRVLTPPALLAKLTDRLAILTGGGADQPVRLRSMGDAIAWSYDLLDPAEQALFRRLAVFVGGFTLDAAEWVAGGESWAAAPTTDPQLSTRNPRPTTLDLLCGLVDASLVARVGDGEPARFAMLETIREWALDRLSASGEVDAARAAHAAWCLDLAERVEPELSGPDQDYWGNLAEAELANVRAAHAYFDEIGDVDRALRLGGALGWIWCSGSFFREGGALLTRLVDLPGADAFPGPLAKVFNAAGDVQSWLVDQDRAQYYYEQALVLYRELGESERTVSLMRALGSVASHNDDLEAAERLLTKSLALALESGIEWEAAAAANLLGVVAFARGDYTLAIAHYTEAERWFIACEDRAHVVTARQSIAMASVAGGSLPQAAALYGDVLDAGVAEGDAQVILECLEGAAAVAWRRGDNARGARLFGAATRQRHQIGTSQRPATRRFFGRCADDLLARLGESLFVEQLGVGGELALVDAVADAPTALRTGDVAILNRCSPVTTRFRLTKREMQILPLLVDGQSDRSIAAALFIGQPTATKHVNAILGKLGASSRTAAAVLAVREGIV